MSISNTGNINEAFLQKNGEICTIEDGANKIFQRDQSVTAKTSRRTAKIQNFY